MRFIKVIAKPCDEKGNSRRHQLTMQNVFYLNTDLIGGISDMDIMLKGGKILFLNGDYYTDFKLKEKINFEKM